MKQTLKENGGLPASILWTLAIVAGISVANLYYNQPLLNMIRHDLGVSEFKTNLIAMVTQIGYALGLLFIIPLGDLYQRKKIIVTNFAILIVSLLTIALAPNIHIILIASFLTGICSVIPQIFVPIASQFSKPENKGRNVGIVISGLLTGILASRVISGFIGEVFGWREMYHIAAALMLICGIVVMKVLPDIRPTFKGKYSDLMKSLFLLLKEYPLLRIYSIRAALAFGSFLAMWSCLAFKMGQAPFYAGSNVIGMQCIQLSNQASIFELCPGASNRVNTIFMTTYFVGGSMGTFLAGSAWQAFGWHGVLGMGVLLTSCSLLITFFSRK